MNKENWICYILLLSQKSQVWDSEQNSVWVLNSTQDSQVVSFGHATRYTSSAFLFTRLEPILKQESVVFQCSLSLRKSCGGRKVLITFLLKENHLHARGRAFSRAFQMLENIEIGKKYASVQNMHLKNNFFQKNARCK